MMRIAEKQNLRACKICGEPEVADGTCVMVNYNSEWKHGVGTYTMKPDPLCRTHLEALKLREPHRITYDYLKRMGMPIKWTPSKRVT